MSLGTEFIVKYLSDISGATKGAKELERINTDIAKTIGTQFANATRIVGTSFEKISTKPITINGHDTIAQIEQLGTVIQDTNGNFNEFTKTNTFIKGVLYKTSGSLKDVTNQFQQTAVGSEKANKNFLSITDNLIRLASRAILTIPIWMALRGAVMGTISNITTGFKDLVDESLALQKVKNTLQGTTDSITTNLEIIKKSTQSLALESGISHEKIIATFQKFSSVGLDVATSLAATNAAIKLSVITQGDATTSAEGFAHALAVLIPLNATVTEKQNQINEIMGLTSELWKTNGFNIEEFTGSLEKFSITAKSVNLTTSQTLALLATLSKSGLGSAGNLLRNSIGQLLVNMDKLAGTLGVKVNPQLDDTFAILVKVLEQLNNLQKVNDLRGLESAKEALKEVFGGTRSAVPIVALSSLYDALKKNISLIGDVNTLNNSFKDTEGVLGNIVARFHTANAEIGKAFVTGIIGGEDFNASLETLVQRLNSIIGAAEGVGEAIRGIGTLGIGPVADTMRKEFTKLNNDIFELGNSIVRGLKGQLTSGELNSLLAQLEAAKQKVGQEIMQPGISEAEIKRRTDSASRLVETIRLLRQIGSVEQASKTPNSDKQLKNIEQQLIYTKDAQEIAKLVLNDSIERLKREGALNSQILLATQFRTQQLGIEEKTIDKLNRKLEIERAINEEKRLQGKLSSDTMKLFDIAKTEGVQVAKQIGDVLAGNLDFENFIRRGGKAVEVFKQQFADFFSQQQALQFFQGNRVSELPNLMGGTNIAINEEAIRKPLSQYDVNIALARRAAEQQFQRLTNITATVPVTVNANIDISKLNEVKKSFISEVSKQLPQVGTEVNDALVQALTGKQGNNL